MALAALTGDEQCIIFSQLCNALDTRIAVAFGSTSSELRAVTQAPRQQLRADHEAAAALCRKMAEGSCKSLVEEGSSSGNWKVTLGIEKSKALEHRGTLLSISCLLDAAAADRLRAHTIPNIPATVPIFYGEDETAASSNLSSGNGLLPTKRKAVLP